MENPRTTSARDHDDSAIIDAAGDLPTPSQSSASGHNIALDVASESEQAEVAEPDKLVRPRKSHDIHSDQAYRSDRGPDRQ